MSAHRLASPSTRYDKGLSAATEPVAVVAGLVAAGAAGVVVGLAPAYWIVLRGTLGWGVGDAVTTAARAGVLQRRTPSVVASPAPMNRSRISH